MIKICLELFKKCKSYYQLAQCVYLSNLKYITQPTLINLHPSKYSEEIYYYPFAVKLDRCNTLNDLSNKIWVPNLNLSMLNMITGIN